MPSARPANVTDFPAGLCVRENTTGNPSCGQKNSDHVSLHRHLDPRHIHSALSLPSEFRSDLLKNTALREAGKTLTKLVTYALNCDPSPNKSLDRLAVFLIKSRARCVHDLDSASHPHKPRLFSSCKGICNRPPSHIVHLVP